MENLGADRVVFTQEEFDALEKALSSCKTYGHRCHVEETPGQGYLNVKPLR